MKQLLQLIILISLLTPSVHASDLLVVDEPVVISANEVRQDLNRALLAVVMKIRGRSTEEIAELQVRLSDQANGTLPDKSEILAPFTFKETRISTLLPGTKPGGGRVAGTFLFEDDFLRQLELAFTLHYQIDESGDSILIHGAGVGENSPLPPVISLLVVESKDVPESFGSHFHTWQDIMAFAVMQRIDLANAPDTHKGVRSYHVFQFVQSHLPSGDWIGSVMSNSPEGQQGDKGRQLINNFDGWKIFTTQVEMDLSSRTPLYFKMLYQPHHTGSKAFDGKTITAATFTPHLGGRFIAQKPAKPDLETLSQADDSTQKTEEFVQEKPETALAIEGNWRSPEWRANMDFWHQGEQFVSHYKLENDKGWIWANKTKDGYEGWWLETGSNEKCASKKNGTHYWGRVTMTFKDGALSGKWSYCNKEPQKKWTARMRGNEHKLGVSPKWSLFGDSVAAAQAEKSEQSKKFVAGKVSPISKDGRVRLEVLDPQEGFRLINEIAGYSLLPPFDNWRISKPESTGQLSIRDQGSCAMSFVPGHLVPGNPDITASPQAFEQHWWQQIARSGKDGSVSRKRSSTVSIAGYPAYAGTYETNGEIISSYFIKLPHNYLIAGFNCAANSAQLAKFEKALSTLKALAGATSPMTMSAPVAAPAPTPALVTPPTPTDQAAETISPDGYTKLFNETGFGFTMPYPKNWSYTKPSNWTVVFSGAQGTDSYYTTVTVQNLSASTYADMDAVIADLKSQLQASGKKHRWHSTLPYLHMDDEGNVQGKQFTMEYWEGDQKLRRTGVLIPRPEAGIYHYWSYTAPEALYGESHDLAEAMRDGFQRIDGN